MSKPREWWANVYPTSSLREKHGACAETREICEDARQSSAAYRIHVRLKPEGAPKRYASEANRRAWELEPAWCHRMMEKYGARPENLSTSR